MKTINKHIRTAVRRGTQYPAIVTDVHGSRASARLSGNGATVHNLSVIGGPAVVGQTVSVDYTTPEPTIVCISQEWLTEDDLNNALKKLGSDSFLNRFSWKILNFAGGELINVYDPSDSGFDEAIASTPAGGQILLPPITLSDDHSFTSGISVVGMSRRNTIIGGKLTVGADGSLENLRVIATGSGSLAGVEGSIAGTFIIENCDILATNSGSGFTCALHDNGTTFYVYSSYLYGSSGGSAYAAWSSAGQIYIYSGKCYGSTDVFVVSV